MAEICGTCVYLQEDNKRECHNWTRGNYCTYYCKERGGYHEQTDRACRYYHRRFGCYIVTEVLDSLDDKNNYRIVYDTFKNWRDNTLSTNIQYNMLVSQYDVIGPKISEAMSYDPLKRLVGLSLMNYYLMPMIEMIHEDKHELAVNKYIEMVMFLKDKYAVNSKTNIDYGNFIHDSIRTRVLSSENYKK